MVRRGAGHLLTRTALATPVWSCHHSRPHQRRRLKRSLYVTLLLILANAADRPSVRNGYDANITTAPTSTLSPVGEFESKYLADRCVWLCKSATTYMCECECVCVCVCVCVYMHAYNLFLYMADMNVYL